MTTNIDRAAEVIDRWAQDHTITPDTGNPHELAQTLADAGLLMPTRADYLRRMRPNDPNPTWRVDTVDGPIPVGVNTSNNLFVGEYIFPNYQALEMPGIIIGATRTMRSNLDYYEGES